MSLSWSILFYLCRKRYGYNVQQKLEIMRTLVILPSVERQLHWLMKNGKCTRKITILFSMSPPFLHHWRTNGYSEKRKLWLEQKLSTFSCHRFWPAINYFCSGSREVLLWCLMRTLEGIGYFYLGWDWIQGDSSKTLHLFNGYFYFRKIMAIDKGSREGKRKAFYR